MCQGRESWRSKKSIVYNLYTDSMTSVTLSQFRSNQGDFIAAAQREPVEITSRGVTRRAVLVSPDFFDRVIEALEDQEDIRTAAEARKDPGPTVSHQELLKELGL